MKRRIRTHTALLVAGGSAVVVGVLLPWARGPGGFPLPMATGLDTSRGTAVLVLGLILIAVGLVEIAPARPGDPIRLVAATVACASSITAIYLLVRYAWILRSTREEVVGPSPVDVIEIHTGVGLAVCLAGAVMALWGGYQMMRRTADVSDDAAVPAPETS